jgi:hypothetical protein
VGVQGPDNWDKVKEAVEVVRGFNLDALERSG